MAKVMEVTSLALVVGRLELLEYSLIGEMVRQKKEPIVTLFLKC